MSNWRKWTDPVSNSCTRYYTNYIQQYQVSPRTAVNIITKTAQLLSTFSDHSNLLVHYWRFASRWWSPYSGKYYNNNKNNNNNHENIVKAADDDYYRNNQIKDSWGFTGDWRFLLRYQRVTPSTDKHANQHQLIINGGNIQSAWKCCFLYI